MCYANGFVKNKRLSRSNEGREGCEDTEANEDIVKVKLDKLVRKVDLGNKRL